MTREQVIEAIRCADVRTKDLGLVNLLTAYLEAPAHRLSDVFHEAVATDAEVVHASLAHLLALRARPDEIWASCVLAKSRHVAGQLAYTILLALNEQLNHGGRPDASQAKTIENFLEMSLESPTGIVCGTAIEVVATIARRLPQLLTPEDRNALWRKVQSAPESVRVDWTEELAYLASTWRE